MKFKFCIQNLVFKFVYKTLLSILFEKFNLIAQKFLDVNLDYVGHMPLSTRIRQSIVSRKPISTEAKDSRENACFQKIAKNILSSPKNETGGIRFFNQQIVQSKRVG